MATGNPPNYYAILDVAETATDQQIRDAYKRAALKTHPDRVATDSPERAVRTRKFQIVNEAYFTLSNTRRRRDYDTQRRLFGHTNTSPDPFAEAGGDTPDSSDPPPSQQSDAGQSAYSWAWDFFKRQAGAAGADPQQAQDAKFSDAFEEMMCEQGMAEDGNNHPTQKFWSLLGGVSGGALGFIVANVPGMVAGAVAGNRLGAVCDAKGKSVYSVFQVSIPERWGSSRRRTAFLHSAPLKLSPLSD